MSRGTCATRVEQIHNIKYPGDAKMRQFYENWISLVEDVDAQLPEETLRRLLREKLEASEELASDLAHFDRLEDDAPDFSHAWLLRRMDRCIQRKKDRTNDEEYNEQIRKTLNPKQHQNIPQTNNKKPTFQFITALNYKAYQNQCFSGPGHGRSFPSHATD